MPAEVVPDAPGIHRWQRRIGLPADTGHLSLGEGQTPLVAERRLAAEYQVGSVLLKLESLCPTGSFKDRAMAAATAHAVVGGSRGLICASSGNAAASAAAYGARAGLPTILLTPQATPAQKLTAGAVYGATQILVPGDYSNSYALALELEHELGLTNVSTTYANADGVVGLRSVAYELAESAPPDGLDAVIVPTSAGPLVHGVVEGFQDLVEIGALERMPRVMAAQPQGCSPIARAFEAGDEAVQPWEGVETVVSGLNDPLRGYAEDGTLTLREVRRSGGAAVAVPDAAIIATQERLATQCGVFVEPAAATAVAAVEPLVTQGHLRPSDTVVCLLTGHGMKQPPRVSTSPIDAGEQTDLAGELRKILAA